MTADPLAPLLELPGVADGVGAGGELRSNSVGSVPLMNTSGIGVGHALVASNSDVPHTVADTTPSGRGQSSGGVPFTATFMYADQMRAGTVPPTTRFIGELSGG